MTDRELLERAAKAAGLALDWYEVDIGDPDCDPGWYCDIAGTRCCWNPLDNDGDALRLAVKLRIDIQTEDDGDGLIGTVLPSGIQGPSEQVNSDPCAATRRAIVRAAAAMGDA